MSTLSVDLNVRFELPDGENKHLWAAIVAAARLIDQEDGMDPEDCETYTYAQALSVCFNEDGFATIRRCMRRTHTPIHELRWYTTNDWRELS